MALESKRTATEELSERVRWLNEHDVGEGPVVYWFHRCLRLEENPALDAALASRCRAKSSTRLGCRAFDATRPLCVDASLDIRAGRAAGAPGPAFRARHPLDIYVESDDRPGSRYREIVERAGLLVAEDLPVASERVFRAKLVDVVQVPFLVVDASCVIPMNHSKKPIRRALHSGTATKISLRRRARAEPKARVAVHHFLFVSARRCPQRGNDVAKVLSFAPSTIPSRR